jgi:hypothetical protein
MLNNERAVFYVVFMVLVIENILGNGVHKNNFYLIF